jgi:hypothetical protein
VYGWLNGGQPTPKKARPQHDRVDACPSCYSERIQNVRITYAVRSSAQYQDQYQYQVKEVVTFQKHVAFSFCSSTSKTFSSISPT